MNAFESLVTSLFRSDGYWMYPNYKVKLTGDEKRAIGRHSSPRWEIDTLAYDVRNNRLLAIECKSYLDSTGVHFRDGKFRFPQRYKLFTEDILRATVLNRLKLQLVKEGLCPENVTVQLCLAVGRIAGGTNRDQLLMYFEKNGWKLFDDRWICDRVKKLADEDYQDDVAVLVAKIMSQQ